MDSYTAFIFVVKTNIFCVVSSSTSFTNPCEGCTESNRFCSAVLSYFVDSMKEQMFLSNFW